MVSTNRTLINLVEPVGIDVVARTASGSTLKYNATHDMTVVLVTILTICVFEHSVLHFIVFNDSS